MADLQVLGTEAKRITINLVDVVADAVLDQINEDGVSDWDLSIEATEADATGLRLEIRFLTNLEVDLPAETLFSDYEVKKQLGNVKSVRIVEAGEEDYEIVVEVTE